MRIYGKSVKKLSIMHVILSLFILVLLNLVFFSFASTVVFAQSTPYSVSGTAQPIDTEFFVIYGVNANDRVLVSINPSSAVEYYYSYVYFPNQTEISYNVASGSQSYNFVAAVSGNYLLSLKTGSASGAGAGFNYTIKSSHSLTQQGPTPSSSPTITPTSPTPLPPITISAVQGDEVTFTIQSAGSNGPKTIDFGDGNISTTSERSISHNYEKAGNYTVMITIPQTTGEKIVQTYLVTVSPKATPTDIFTQLTDVKVIIAIISTIIGALSFYLAYKNYKGKQTRNENKPIPPPPPI
jgi:PKD repeat protein